MLACPTLFGTEHSEYHYAEYFSVFFIIYWVFNIVSDTEYLMLFLMDSNIYLLDWSVAESIQMHYYVLLTLLFSARRYHLISLQTVVCKGDGQGSHDLFADMNYH